MNLISFKLSLQFFNKGKAMENKGFGIPKLEVISFFGTQNKTAEALSIKQSSVAGWSDPVSNGIRLKAIGAARCMRKAVPETWLKAS